MPSKSALDLAAIRDSVRNTGEFRVHLVYSRSGMGCRARMWHPDGFVLGSAGGCGYDRAGAALGQVIEKILGEELKALPLPKRRANGSVESGLYGMNELSDGRRILDGACGLACMLAILTALGFDARDYSTGRYSTMILATRAPKT